MAEIEEAIEQAIAMAKIELPRVTVNIEVETPEGFGVTITIRSDESASRVLEALSQLSKKLVVDGYKPGWTSMSNELKLAKAEQAPEPEATEWVCPEHGDRWVKESSKVPGQRYCTFKKPDGYCKHTSTEKK